MNRRVAFYYFGIAFSQAICVIDKYIGKALLETGF